MCVKHDTPFVKMKVTKLSSKKTGSNSDDNYNSKQVHVLSQSEKLNFKPKSTKKPFSESTNNLDLLINAKCFVKLKDVLGKDTKENIVPTSISSASSKEKDNKVVVERQNQTDTRFLNLRQYNLRKLNSDERKRNPDVVAKMNSRVSSINVTTRTGRKATALNLRGKSLESRQNKTEEKSKRKNTRKHAEVDLDCVGKVANDQRKENERGRKYKETGRTRSSGNLDGAKKDGNFESGSPARRRGRSKKETNAQNEVENNGDNCSKMVNRDKTNKDNSDGIKSGKPRKIINDPCKERENNAKDKENARSSNNLDKTKQDEFFENVSPTRRRGRPRRETNTQNEDEINGENSEKSDDVKSPRGRGRPRKNTNDQYNKERDQKNDLENAQPSSKAKKTTNNTNKETEANTEKLNRVPRRINKQANNQKDLTAGQKKLTRKESVEGCSSSSSFSVDDGAIRKRGRPKKTTKSLQDSQVKSVTKQYLSSKPNKESIRYYFQPSVPKEKDKTSKTNVLKEVEENKEKHVQTGKTKNVNESATANFKKRTETAEAPKDLRRRNVLNYAELSISSPQPPQAANKPQDDAGGHVPIYRKFQSQQDAAKVKKKGNVDLYEFDFDESIDSDAKVKRKNKRRNTSLNVYDKVMDEIMHRIQEKIEKKNGAKLKPRTNAKVHQTAVTEQKKVVKKNKVVNLKVGAVNQNVRGVKDKNITEHGATTRLHANTETIEGGNNVENQDVSGKFINPNMRSIKHKNVTEHGVAARLHIITEKIEGNVVENQNMRSIKDRNVTEHGVATRLHTITETIEGNVDTFGKLNSVTPQTDQPNLYVENDVDGAETIEQIEIFSSGASEDDMFYGFDREETESNQGGRPSSNVNIISNTLIKQTCNDSVASLPDVSFRNFRRPNANSTMIVTPKKKSSPWRPNFIGVRRNPHLLSYKKSALPNYEQDMVLESSFFENSLIYKSRTPGRVNENSRTPFRLEEPFRTHLSVHGDENINAPAHDGVNDGGEEVDDLQDVEKENSHKTPSKVGELIQKASVQTSILDFIGASPRISTRNVMNNVSLFDEAEFSPIRCKAPPRKRNNDKAKRNLCDIENISPDGQKQAANVQHVQSTPLYVTNRMNIPKSTPIEKQGNDLETYFGFNSFLEEENHPKRRKPVVKDDLKKPTRINLKVVKKVLISEEPPVIIENAGKDGENEDVLPGESSQIEGELPEEVSEIKVGLFEDLEPSFTKPSKRCYERPRTRRRRLPSLESKQSEEDEEDEELAKPKKKKRNVRSKAEELEAKKWYAQFNAMCEEVEQHNLALE